METTTTLRRLLQSVGLRQYERPHARAVHGAGSGDYSVRYDTETTYTRRGVGYRTRQRSTRTGLVRVELHFTAQVGASELVSQTLTDGGFTFTQPYSDTFLVTPQ